MSLLALGRNGRSQAGAEASGLDSLMGWAYTTIEFTLFLWSIAVGLAYDGLAALLTSRVYRAGAGAVLLYLLGTTLIELVASGDGGPELLFFLRMAVFVYCVGYQVRALCDYTPVRVLLILSGGYPLFRHGAEAIAEPFRDYAAMGPYAGVLLTFSAIYLATRSMGRHVGYFMDTYIKTYVLETRIDSLLRRVRGGGAHADEPSEESVSLLHAYLRARGGLLCTLSVAVYQYGLVMIPLLVLGGLGGVGAVCPSCGSSIASCTYDTDQRCPTITIVATNASAMAGVGVVSTVTLATLIRPRYLRIFGTNALQALVAMRRRPAAGTPFSITADTSKGDIVQAISAGRISQMEAVEQLAQQLSGVEAEEEGEEKTRKLANITRSLDLLRTLKETAIPDAGGSEHGPTVPTGDYTFTFAKVSREVADGVAKSSTTASLNAGTTTTQRATSVHSARIVYPKTESEFGAALNLWLMISSGLGTSPTELTAFLQYVVYETILDRGHPWQLAVCLFVAFIRKVEESGGALSLRKATEEVYLAGMMDEARLILAAVYPNVQESAFFRTRGGEPRSGETGNTAKKWNGRFSSDGAPCTAWNLGKAHVPSMLKPDGTCKHNHVCDQFVTDQGKFGRCAGKVGPAGHKRADCPNPNKCSTPHKG